jgi:transposase
VSSDADILPDDIDALRAALAAERAARQSAEARATGAEAMIAHLKLLIAKLQRDRFGPTSERSRRLLDQLELQLEELEADTAEADAEPVEPLGPAPHPARAKPVRGPLPQHLPRKRVVIPGPTVCPCCNGRLVKLGETITETLEVIPRQWKVVQTVRKKFSCRTCETITQPPAPFHPIARGRAGPELLAMILEARFGQHLPLNRQSESYALEGIHLDISTLGGWVGACTAALAPLLALIRQYVLAADRLHGDDTTVPVLAKSKTITGRLWTYVRDDRPFGGPEPPAAVVFFHAIEAASIRDSIWRAMRASCRPTPMPGSTSSICPGAYRARSPGRRAGRTAGGSSLCWPTWPRRRSPSRPCVGST